MIMCLWFGVILKEHVTLVKSTLQNFSELSQSLLMTHWKCVFVSCCFAVWRTFFLAVLKQRTVEVKTLHEGRLWTSCIQEEGCCYSHHCIVSYAIVLNCMESYIVSYHIILHRIVQYCFVSYEIVKNPIEWYCTILYHIKSHQIIWNPVVSYHELFFDFHPHWLLLIVTELTFMWRNAPFKGLQNLDFFFPSHTSLQSTQKSLVLQDFFQIKLDSTPTVHSVDFKCKAITNFPSVTLLPPTLPLKHHMPMFWMRLPRRARCHFAQQPI